MSEATQGDSYNEDFATFFEGELVGEADLIYRLAFACALDSKKAFAVVEKVYKDMVKELPKLVKMTAQEVRIRLLEECYSRVKEKKESKASDKSSLASFLEPYSLQERASLVMVELAGIYPSECALILGTTEVEVRRFLSKARSNLIEFTA